VQKKSKKVKPLNRLIQTLKGNFYKCVTAPRCSLVKSFVGALSSRIFLVKSP
jgi:hypothetical protein